MIAKKDIAVYKCFSNWENPSSTKVQKDSAKLSLVSPCFGTFYIRGEKYSNDLLVDAYNRIEIGLHSYVSLNAAEFCDFTYTNKVILKCIIPKGAHYYLGTEQDVVSNELIIGKRNLYKS